MPTHRPLPPLARLQELLAYDPEEGVLRWRVGNHGRTVGAEAGWLGADGYRRVNLDTVTYQAHRLAYYMGTGTDPGTYQIDHHPDPTRTNNRLVNMRLAAGVADNCSTRGEGQRTRPVEVVSPEGEVTACPSMLAGARLMGCARKTALRHLARGTATAMGWRVRPVCNGM
jgi:hypothetical protein